MAAPLRTREEKLEYLLELLDSKDDEGKRQQYQEQSDAELDLRIGQIRRIQLRTRSKQ